MLIQISVNKLASNPDCLSALTLSLSDYLLICAASEEHKHNGGPLSSKHLLVCLCERLFSEILLLQKLQNIFSLEQKN